MSLFGDDYETSSTTSSSTAAANLRSSLFGDEPATPRTSVGTSRSARSVRQSIPSAVPSSTAALLFGEDDSGDPWSRPPARANAKPTVSTLLDPSKCPAVYRDSFASEGPVNSTVSLESVRRAADRAGLSSSSGERIVQVIARAKPDGRVDDGTWCVVMALIGLAQEGEDDLSLDSVDARRYSLPNTRIRYEQRPPPKTKSSRKVQARPAPVETPAPTPAPTPAARQAYAPPPLSIQTSRSRQQQQQQQQMPEVMTPPSPSSPPPIAADDPWANPSDEYSSSNAYTSSSNNYTPYNDYNQSSYSTNLNNNTTSFTVPDDDDDDDDVDPYGQSSNYPPATAAYSSYNSGSAENNYNPNYSAVLGADYNELARPRNNINAALLTDEPITIPNPQTAQVVEDEDSDAEEEDEERDPNDPEYVASFPYTRAQPYYDAHETDRIRVTIIPEKEGVLMFKHVNYLLEGQAMPNADGTLARGGYRVVRRYSDFVWLLNCLLKRYPFRLLPLLPPKRFAVNGHYLSSDEFFLERRRRGLSRFINELVKHPVLSREQIVVMFLTVPTELAVWRKQASVSIEDEFTGRALPAGLIESWSEEEAQRWEDVKEGVKNEAELYTHLCLLIDRMEKRQESVAADHQRFASSLGALQEVTQRTYSVDTDDLSLINDGVKNVAKYLNNARTLLEDESRGWEIGVLEDFKRHRDGLIAIKELFDRKEKLDMNQIPHLERRIRNNETRLGGMRNRSDFKQSEIERVEAAIKRDKDAIKEQHTRSWLIKECMRDEMAYFQQTKYRVAKLFQDYAQERLKYAELFAENWRTLSNEISEVPTQAS